jgi:hypothetical protein
MMPTMSFHPSTLSAVMRALRASHGLCTLPFHAPPTPRRALAWVGFLVGICVLALQGAAVTWISSERPRLIAQDPGSAPGIMRLVIGLCPALHGSGESPEVVSVDHGWLPCHRLARDVCEADDDDPVTPALRTATVLGWPPASREGIPGGTHRHAWPSRFLARPQLLTRL